MRPNLTLNLGVNYSYQEPPKGTQLQALNAIASVPGLIEFHAPKAQKKNFATEGRLCLVAELHTEACLGRVFGTSGKSSIRAGFSMGYDYIFDNLYILSLPPQSQQTIDTSDRCLDGLPYTPNFLASGGIPQRPVPAAVTMPQRRVRNTARSSPIRKCLTRLPGRGSFQRQFMTELVARAALPRNARHSPADAEPHEPPARRFARTVVLACRPSSLRRRRRSLMR